MYKMFSAANSQYLERDKNMKKGNDGHELHVGHESLHLLRSEWLKTNSMAQIYLQYHPSWGSKSAGLGPREYPRGRRGLPPGAVFLPWGADCLIAKVDDLGKVDSPEIFVKLAPHTLFTCSHMLIHKLCIFLLKAAESYVGHESLHLLRSEWLKTNLMV